MCFAISKWWRRRDKEQVTSSPTPKELYEALLKEFSEEVLPSDFVWMCDCFHPRDGLPGCNNLEHFCTQVCLAITSYHQYEETIRRDELRHQHQLLRPECFSRRRERLYHADLARALDILRQEGVELSPKTKRAV
jgi:hypothetical protein